MNMGSHESVDSHSSSNAAVVGGGGRVGGLGGGSLFNPDRFQHLVGLKLIDTNNGDTIPNERAGEGESWFDGRKFIEERRAPTRSDMGRRGRRLYHSYRNEFCSAVLDTRLQTQIVALFFCFFVCLIFFGRIVRPGSMMTMDHRPNRLNIHLDQDGKVERVAMG